MFEGGRSRALLLALLVTAPLARAQSVQPESVPPRFTSLARPELVALTNIGANPGVGAASFTVDQPGGQPSLHIGFLGIRGGYDVTSEDKKLALYLGGGVGQLKLSDAFVGTLDNGDHVRMDTDKHVTSGGLLVGLEYRPWEILHIRPEVAFGLSRLTNQSSFPNGDPSPFLGLRDARLDHWDLWAWTIAPAIDVSLDWSFGNHHRLELQLTWAHGFHHSFAESAEELHFSGYTNTLYGRAQFTSPTGLSLGSIPLDWDVQYQVTQFFTEETDPLGFSTVMVASGGLDLRFDQKIWLFPLRSVGPQVGFLFGPHVHGFALGLSVRG